VSDDRDISEVHSIIKTLLTNRSRAPRHGVRPEYQDYNKNLIKLQGGKKRPPHRGDAEVSAAWRLGARPLWAEKTLFQNPENPESGGTGKHNNSVFPKVRYSGKLESGAKRVESRNGIDDMNADYNAWGRHRRYDRRKKPGHQSYSPVNINMEHLSRFLF
jgi:hypothetical protein